MVSIAFLPKLKMSNERKQWWLAFCWMMGTLFFLIGSLTAGSLVGMIHKGFAVLFFNGDMSAAWLSGYVGIFNFAWLFYAIFVFVEFVENNQKPFSKVFLAATGAMVLSLSVLIIGSMYYSK